MFLCWGYLNLVCICAVPDGSHWPRVAADIRNVASALGCVVHKVHTTFKDLVWKKKTL